MVKSAKVGRTGSFGCVARNLGFAVLIAVCDGAERLQIPRTVTTNAQSALNVQMAYSHNGLANSLLVSVDASLEAAFAVIVCRFRRLRFFIELRLPTCLTLATAGNAHEFGGKFRREHYPKRPFMGPALEKVKDRLPPMWAGSIR